MQYPFRRLIVREADGSPALADCRELVFPNGSLTISNGVATLTVSGGGAASDLLSPLTAAEAAVTGAATLTAGRLHVCSGTTADYTVTLPALSSGDAGKWVGVRMAAGLTRLVTVDAGSGVLIDGQQTRVMWAGEAAFLFWTGTAWAKTHGRSLPMQARIQLQHTTDANYAQDISHATMTPVAHNEGSGSVASLYDLTGSPRTITVKRSGLYEMLANTAYNGNPGWSATRVLARVYRNGGTEVLFGEVAAVSGGYPTFGLPGYLLLAAGDVLHHATYQISGATQYLYGGRANYFQVLEVPTW